VTVIAAGFDGGEPGAKVAEVRRSDLVAAGIAAGSSSAGASAGSEVSSGHYVEELTSSSVWSSGESTAGGAVVADPAFEDDADDLDIPDFLK
ncbi:MAG: cell division protein FtsZ, partial [Cryobacterium sp.]